MSLSSFINQPEVRAKIKVLRPPPPRVFDRPILVKPRSNRRTVGTAFDYLLRFELERRAPHCVTHPWVAEQTLKLLLPREIRSKWSSFDPTELHLHVAPDDESLCVQEVIQSAKHSLESFVACPSPSPEQREEMAWHSVRLAKLDVFVRAMELDPTYQEAEPDDVADLVALLDIVPFEKLIHPEIMHLNPVFNESSRTVGGADTDMFSGDMMVDFKTSKENKVTVHDLDQMLGYYLLACRQKRVQTEFPSINQIGLYFARFAHLLTWDVSFWTEQPQFCEIYEWFFERAKEVYRQA